MGQLEHFEKSSLLVILIHLALRTRTPGGRGVKNWQNFADVFYGWPLSVSVSAKLTT